MLLMRTGFNAVSNPDLAFHLTWSGSREPNQCGSMQIGIQIRLCRHEKLDLTLKIYLIKIIWVIWHKNTYVGPIAFSKGWKSSLFFFHFGQIRIRILNTDLEFWMRTQKSQINGDPCGSESETPKRFTNLILCHLNRRRSPQPDPQLGS